MRVYETTFIINPQSDDATIEKHVSDVKEMILKTDGKIISENHMGTRRLAYEIDKLTQGYYATFLYEAPTDILPLLDHHFKVNEAFIRDLTVRIECDPQEYLKQQDPFGKHGSDRPDDSRRGHRGDRGDRPAPGKPAEKSGEKPEVKEETAAVKTEEKTETAAVKTEAKAETSESDNASKEDKPQDDKE